MSKREKPLQQRAYFKTIIRGTRTFIYDRNGKLRKIITMHRRKEPLIYEEIDTKPNPDKILIARIGKDVELFTYKNSPNNWFLGTKTTVIVFENDDVKKFMRASARLANYFEVLEPFRPQKKTVQKQNRNINITVNKRMISKNAT